MAYAFLIFLRSLENLREETNKTICSSEKGVGKRVDIHSVNIIRNEIWAMYIGIE